VRHHPDVRPSAVELTDVQFRYPSRPAPVLDGVSLRVPWGAVTRLQGANGVGKTTVLRLLVGLLAPQGGTLRVAGLDPVAERLAVQRSIGYVSAGNGGLYARLTVAQHLAIWARLRFVDRTRRPYVVARALAAFGLEPLARYRVDRLSMGQRQRVRLALGLLDEPRVLLLDEPETSLDGNGREALAAAIDRIVASDGAVLWCSPADGDGGGPGSAALHLDAGRVTTA
jgi:ABC-2 type transport system ATP-binding protein